MNKTTQTIIAIAITAFIPVYVFATPAPKVSGPVSTAQSSGWSDVIVIDNPTSIIGDPSSTASPAVGSSVSTAVPQNTPSVTPHPAVGSSVSTASPVTPAVGDSVSTAVPPTPTPAPATNGSSSGSSSSSSGGRMNSAYMYGCPLITTYMKYGANNNVAEVTKLQNFLKNVEKLDVDVNGTFDKKTENAVIAFQNKYSTVTMGPWGANNGTGFVYITTVKQINKIACNQPLSLSVSELATINSFKNKRDANVSVTEIKPAATIDITPATEPTDAEIGDAPKVGEENTASVGRTSIVNKFWNFLVYLFK